METVRKKSRKKTKNQDVKSDPVKLVVREEVIAFRKSLTPETDRGVALVCAAYLEKELETLLRSSFVDDAKVADRLFEGTGALGTFSSKIDLAFAIGCIERDIHRGLHLVRRMRNDFAHDHAVLSFTDEAMGARCRELVGLNPYPEENNPRNLFIRACMSILAIVHIRSMVAQRPSPFRSEATEYLSAARPIFLKVRSTVKEVISEVAGKNSKGKGQLGDVESQKMILSEILRRVIADREQPNNVKKKVKKT